MSKHNDTYKTFAQTMLASANERHARATELEAIHNNTDDDDTKREYLRTRTHAEYDAKVSGMSESAQRFACDVLNADASNIAKQSRELKKRMIAACESAANKVRTRDKAMNAFIDTLKSGNRKQFTLEQVQTIMQHKTATQARNLRTILQYFGALEKCDADSFTVKRDHALIVALIEAAK